jgi:hypothetical protein
MRSYVETIWAAYSISDESAAKYAITGANPLVRRWCAVRFSDPEAWLDLVDAVRRRVNGRTLVSAERRRRSPKSPEVPIDVLMSSLSTWVTANVLAARAGMKYQAVQQALHRLRIAGDLEERPAENRGSGRLKEYRRRQSTEQQAA